MQAEKDEKCGNDELAKKKRRGVFALNITAIVSYFVVLIVVIIIATAVRVATL